jgi:hypothetical protein
VATIRDEARFPRVEALGATPTLLDLVTDQANFSFLEELDGLLISVAPSRQKESCEEVFSRESKSLLRFTSALSVSLEIKVDKRWVGDRHLIGVTR